MTGDEIRDATMSAVAEAVEETGFKEPLQGRESAAPEAKSSPDGDDESGDAKPSAADLAAIDADPRAREVYRRLTREFHGRMSQIAADEKESATAREAVAAIRADPQKAARAFVAAVGLRVAGDAAPQTLLDRAQARMAKEFGPEAAAIMAPVFLEIASDAVKEATGPVTEHIQQQRAIAERAQIKQVISTFATGVIEDGGAWNEEIELEMAELVKSGKIRPGAGANAADFLGLLYSQVEARRARAARRAPAPAEREGPRGNSVVKAGMKPLDAVRAAVASAKQDLGY